VATLQPLVKPTKNDSISLSQRFMVHGGQGARASASPFRVVE